MNSIMEDINSTLLFQQYRLYSELQSKSVNDEIYLSKLENEIARRSKISGVDLFSKIMDDGLYSEERKLL
jgi:hypothetical protein